MICKNQSKGKSEKVAHNCLKLSKCTVDFRCMVTVVSVFLSVFHFTLMTELLYGVLKQLHTKFSNYFLLYFTLVFAQQIFFVNFIHISRTVFKHIGERIH